MMQSYITPDGDVIRLDPSETEEFLGGLGSSIGNFFSSDTFNDITSVASKVGDVYGKFSPSGSGGGRSYSYIPGQYGNSNGHYTNDNGRQEELRRIRQQIAKLKKSDKGNSGEGKNTFLYIGIGLGTLLFIGLLIAILKK